MDTRDLRTAITIRCPRCSDITNVKGEKKRVQTKIGHITIQCTKCGITGKKTVITGRKWLTMCELRKAMWIVATNFISAIRGNGKQQNKIAIKDDNIPSGFRHLTIY